MAVLEQDVKTGVETPLSFGRTLDCRNPRRVGDSNILETLALPAGRLCEHLEGRAR